MRPPPYRNRPGLPRTRRGVLPAFVTCLTLCSWLLGGAWADEDPLADLRAEAAAASAKADLSALVQRKGDGGPEYVTRNLTLSGDEVSYGLSYKSFLPPNNARNQAELNDWAGGLGMTRPSDKGWYSNGFVMVTLSDKTGSASTADYCADAKLVKASGRVVAGDFLWQLPTGSVTLRFMLLADRPELFLQVSAAPKAPDASLAVEFRCYPGGFAAPFDRWVHTTARELQNAGAGKAEVTLDPAREKWMVLADHYAGVTPRPMGPCSLAADPEGLAGAGARIDGNYGVTPFYRLAPGRTRALFVIRAFVPMAWREALAEVAATTDEALAAGRQAAASLP